MPKLKTSNIDALIGYRIRKARKARGLTLDNVAGKIGVSAQQLRHYEIGQAAVSVSRLVAIAKALGRKTQFFLEGRE